MPAQTSTSPPPAGDDLDDLFNYDVNTDDVFRDYNPAMDAPARPTSPARPSAADLGIDEEIQTTIPSRDTETAAHHEGEAEIQGQRPRGIGLLLYMCARGLTVGSKYEDVARLLNVYQLWLDDLYPRAKFADGLAIIEKLGHTKRLQTMRREWIKEGRPLERREEEAASSEISSQPTAIATGTRTEEGLANAHTTGVNETASRPPTSKPTPSASKSSKEESLFISDDDLDPHPSDDELDALLAEDALLTTSTTPAITPGARRPHEADQHPPDDDLDALLAEDTFHPPSAPTAARPSTTKHDEFEDEMEAMAGMDDMW
ncbi:chromosome segregation in meiosis- protein [Xylographa soralifera]|nr:chromosome segregation in meiosis- protein [Xylographa soralifera]